MPSASRSNPTPPGPGPSPPVHNNSAGAGCPELSAVERFIDGGLSRDESIVIASHLTQCTSCREMSVEMKANQELATSLRGVMRTAAATMPATSTALPTVPGYQLVSELGRGGMGVVYEALQLTTRRTIALKVLHGSLAGSGEHENLLQREAWAMARLDHPSIAAIYEAGRASDGRPFVAMELVRGPRMGDALRTAQRTPAEIVALFLTLARAVGHAHLRGVIHRDLKPSNIILAPSAAPRPPDEAHPADIPKILDFGLARIAAETTASRSDLTRDDRVASTPAYMSPEQAEGRSAAIGPATDVYALGIMLFESLTGQLPYEVSRTSVVAAANTIANTPPRKPSSIDRSLRGDLETIILKALAKDPADRYPDASSLAADLEAFLADRPIEAARPSTLRRVALFTRRHRVASITVGGIALLVIAFSIAMTVLYLQSQGRLVRAIEAEAKQRAATRRAITEATAGYDLQGVLTDAATNENNSLPAPTHKALELAADRCMNGPADPAVRATGLFMISTIYSSLGDHAQAKRCLDKCLILRKAALPAEAPEIAETLSALGSLASSQGDDSQAIAAARAALVMATKAFGEGHAHVSNEHVGLIHALTHAGKLEEAAEQSHALIAAYERDTVVLFNLVEIVNSVAGAFFAQDRLAEPIDLMRDAIDAMDRHGDGDHVGCWATRSNLALHLLVVGKAEESLRMAVETADARGRLLPPGNNGILSTRLLQAMGLAATGKLESATRLAADVAQSRRQTLAPDNPVRIRTEAILHSLNLLLGTPSADSQSQNVLAAMNARGSDTDKRATLRLLGVIVRAAPSIASPARAQLLVDLVATAREAPLTVVKPSTDEAPAQPGHAGPHGQPAKKAPM